MKLRDLLAVPFWLLGQTLIYISVKIGGPFTAQLTLDNYVVKETVEKYYDHITH